LTHAECRSRRPCRAKRPSRARSSRIRRSRSRRRRSRRRSRRSSRTRSSRRSSRSRRANRKPQVQTTPRTRVVPRKTNNNITMTTNDRSTRTNTRIKMGIGIRSPIGTSVVPRRAGISHIIHATRRTLITILPVRQIPAKAPKHRRNNIDVRRKIKKTAPITTLQIKIPNSCILPHSRARRSPTTR